MNELGESIQIIELTGRFGYTLLKLVGVSIKETKNIVQFMTAYLDSQVVAGQMNIVDLLKREGGDIQTFIFEESRMAEVKEQLEARGIMYSQLPDLNLHDGMAEIMFPTSATPRIEAMIDRLGFGSIGTMNDYINNASPDQLDPYLEKAKELAASTPEGKRILSLQKKTDYLNCYESAAKYEIEVNGYEKIEQSGTELYKIKVPGSEGELIIDGFGFAEIDNDKGFGFLEMDKEYEYIVEGEREQLLGKDAYNLFYEHMQTPLAKEDIKTSLLDETKQVVFFPENLLINKANGFVRVPEEDYGIVLDTMFKGNKEGQAMAVLDKSKEYQLYNIFDGSDGRKLSGNTLNLLMQGLTPSHLEMVEYLRKDRSDEYCVLEVYPMQIREQSENSVTFKLPNEDSYVKLDNFSHIKLDDGTLAIQVERNQLHRLLDKDGNLKAGQDNILNTDQLSEMYFADRVRSNAKYEIQEVVDQYKTEVSQIHKKRDFVRNMDSPDMQYIWFTEDAGIQKDGLLIQIAGEEGLYTHIDSNNVIDFGNIKVAFLEMDKPYEIYQKNDTEAVIDVQSGQGFFNKYYAERQERNDIEKQVESAKNKWSPDAEFLDASNINLEELEGLISEQDNRISEWREETYEFKEKLIVLQNIEKNKRSSVEPTIGNGGIKLPELPEGRKATLAALQMMGVHESDEGIYPITIDRKMFGRGEDEPISLMEDQFARIPYCPDQYIFIEHEAALMNGRKTMLTYLEKDKKYVIYNADHQAIAHKTGEELFKEHYDPVLRTVKKQVQANLQKNQKQSGNKVDINKLPVPVKHIASNIPKPTPSAIPKR